MRLVFGRLGWMGTGMYVVVRMSQALLDTTGGGSDNTLITILAPLGSAAPFAAVCFWQMNRAQKKSDDWETKYTNQASSHAVDLKAKDDQIQRMNDAALQRERENTARLAPLVYDGALLYKQGNEALAKTMAEPVVEKVETGVDKVDALTVKVDGLIEFMNRGRDT